MEGQGTRWVAVVEAEAVVVRAADGLEKHAI